MTKIRIPMDMHNTFRECDAGYEVLDKNAKAVVDSRMRPLIEKIQLKRPGWHFISQSNAGIVLDNGSYAFQRFVVEEDGDELGRLDTSRNWRTSEDVFELDNPRLRSKRERNGYTKTKDLKKATKLVLDNYYGLTLEERLSSAKRTRNGVLSERNNRSGWEVDSIMRDAQPQLVNFLTNNPSVMEQFMMTVAPKIASKLSTLTEAVESSKAAREMHDLNASGKGATVMLWRDKFYVVNAHDDKFEFTYDTVPPQIAMAVGMLKLVGVKDVIPGIGTRVANDVFFVAYPESTSE